MTLRSFRLVPTLVVLAAVGVMVALGFWQLDRMDQKEALLAHYAAVAPDAPPVEYPQDEDALEANLYRRTSAKCTEVTGRRDVAGTNAVGAKGWAHIAACTLEGGQSADIALGWSRNPEGPKWSGGDVSGVLGPGGKIVTDPPLAGLGPLAKPDPADLPNNHLSYAVQWFLFALTALIIYVLAVSWRQRTSGEKEIDVKETFGS